MPVPISLSHSLMKRHWEYRQTVAGQILGPDAKAQVTVRYADGRPEGIAAVVLSSQHSAGIELDKFRAFLEEQIMRPVLGDALRQDTILHLNPAGTFVVGGPVADAGLTGRKIIVDTYGGMPRSSAISCRVLPLVSVSRTASRRNSGAACFRFS
jgi:S-adenosylmethionine synthetase